MTSRPDPSLRSDRGQVAIVFVAEIAGLIVIMVAAVATTRYTATGRSGARGAGRLSITDALRYRIGGMAG